MKTIHSKIKSLCFLCLFLLGAGIYAAPDQKNVADHLADLKSKDSAVVYGAIVALAESDETGQSIPALLQIAGQAGEATLRYTALLALAQLPDQKNQELLQLCDRITQNKTSDPLLKDLADQLLKMLKK